MEERTPFFAFFAVPLRPLRFKLLDDSAKDQGSTAKVAKAHRKGRKD